MRVGSQRGWIVVDGAISCLAFTTALSPALSPHCQRTRRNGEGYVRSLVSTLAADLRQHAAEDRMKESETADLTAALLEAWSETNQAQSELARTRGAGHRMG